MKIFMIECTAEELRANRGIMDAVVDACRDFANAFYGTMPPFPIDQESDSEEESEDTE